MKKCKCLLCRFENPKASVTAIVIKDQELLVVKRSQEPFKGRWDFVGGYVNKNESLEHTLKREIKEELKVNSELTFIGSFTGESQYKGYLFPIINFAYLAELKSQIKLDRKENSEFTWVPIEKLKTIAFNSNQKILELVEKKFKYDLEKVKYLISQLDSSVKINEQSLYKAILNGYVSKLEINGKLIGMGWIFPRQTLCRSQAVIEDMIVDEKYRGKGYGKKILLDLIRWAKLEGVEVVELTTNSKRVVANELYKKVGFKIHETNHYLLKL